MDIFELAFAKKLGGGSGSSGGSTIKNQDKNITENGSYSADSGYTGLGIVTVNVPVDSKIDELISRTVTEMTEKDFEGITSIGASAFRDCAPLVSVVMPTTIKSIGDYAFEGCTNLSIYYKGTQEEWGAISVGTHSASLYLYYYSENEPTVSGNFWHYVDGVVTAWAVYVEPSYSEGLAYTRKGDVYTVSGIGACTDTDIIIPYAVDNILVTSIGEAAFRDCSNLTSINIPDSVTSIGINAFRGCKSLTSINIPAGVTNIGTATFRDCSNLTSINIPDSVTSIGDSAFYQCTKLTSINIPYGITVISSSTFKSCKSLTSVTIPASVTSIGINAFDSCTAMQTYDFTSHTEVPTLSGTGAFWNIPSTCQIKVPASLYDEWITATNWSNFASNIVAV